MFKRITSAALLVMLLVMASCMEEQDGDSQPIDAITNTGRALEGAALETFDGRYIEIDRLSIDPADDVGNADLVLNGHTDYPPCPGDCEYIDWEDLCTEALVENHRIIDETKLDYSSFPRSNHCVDASHVLSKMDLTYAMVSNNAEYAYFAVQRRNNNGDAAYYWLFTRVEPTLDDTDPDCHGEEEGLNYVISDGDVLLRGSFSPSSGVALVVYQGLSSAGAITAVDAIDYTNTGLWTEVTDPTILSGIVSTVNTASIDPTVCDTGGVDKQAMSGSMLEAELFAEASVPIEAFQSNGNSLCDLTFWGSVITRPSGSGGTSPDLKDLIGPQLFKFGELVATAELKPSCLHQFSAELTGVSGFGGDIPLDGGVTCDWTFENDNPPETITTTGCGLQNIYPSTAGTFTGSVDVTVELPGGGICNTSKDNLSVDAWELLVATATATPNCEKQFYYEGTVGGGSDATTYGWTFEGMPPEPGVPTPTSSGSLTGWVDVLPADLDHQYKATLTVDDPRLDVEPPGCTVSATAYATPLSPLSVNLTLAGPYQTCANEYDDSVTSDAVTYNAVVTGGTGVYSYDWLDPDACLGEGDSCTFDPSDSDFCVHEVFQVEVTDADLSCSTRTSETETYTKITNIHATDD